LALDLVREPEVELDEVGRELEDVLEAGEAGAGAVVVDGEPRAAGAQPLHVLGDRVVVGDRGVLGDLEDDPSERDRLERRDQRGRGERLGREVQRQAGVGLVPGERAGRRRDRAQLSSTSWPAVAPANHWSGGRFGAPVKRASAS